MTMTRSRRDARRAIERRTREHDAAIDQERDVCGCPGNAGQSLPLFEECVREAARNFRPFPYDEKVHETDVKIRRALARDEITAVVTGMTDPLPPVVRRITIDELDAVAITDHGEGFLVELRDRLKTPGVRVCIDCRDAGDPRTLAECVHPDHCPF